jgi:hypothetical protein
VVVVPTRELGVQLVMLIYKLFGGSVNAGIPGAGGNIFNYSGPRGLKVGSTGTPTCVFRMVGGKCWLRACCCHGAVTIGIAACCF